MAKTTGPLMSMDASGSVAGTIVFSKWKGRNYVRQHVRPSNPQTKPQIANRAMMSFLSKAWALNSLNNQQSFTAPADSDKHSTFNAYTKYNMNRWRHAMYPQASYQAVPATFTSSLSAFAATAGVAQITLTATITDVAGTSWGIIIYGSSTTGFTPTKTDVIGIIPAATGVDVTFVDSPLAAVARYYRAAPISEDGQIGTLHAQITATPL